MDDNFVSRVIYYMSAFPYMQATAYYCRRPAFDNEQEEPITKVT